MQLGYINSPYRRCKGSGSPFRLPPGTAESSSSRVAHREEVEPAVLRRCEWEAGTTTPFATVKTSPEALAQLLAMGGFPEPFTETELFTRTTPCRVPALTFLSQLL